MRQANATILALLVIILALIAGLDMDAEKEAETDLKLYCEMVEIRQTTGNPNLGWPDYKGIYERECNGY